MGRIGTGRVGCELMRKVRILGRGRDRGVYKVCVEGDELVGR